MRSMRCLLTVLLSLGAASAAPAFAKGGAAQVERADDAVMVLKEIMAVPEKRVPDALFAKAEAIAVIPNVVKASFVVGGRRGRGLVSVRNADGSWSNPSYVTITGGSLGLQAGVQSTDVVLVFRTRRGVDSMVHGKFTLGADAAVAAGPVGRNANASTDGELKAEIYSYSRSRGLFAGVALDGAVLAIDHDANEKVFGDNTTARQIFEGKVRDVPGTIVEFRDLLEEYTAK